METTEFWARVRQTHHRTKSRGRRHEGECSREKLTNLNISNISAQATSHDDDLHRLHNDAVESTLHLLHLLLGILPQCFHLGNNISFAGVPLYYGFDERDSHDTGPASLYFPVVEHENNLHFRLRRGRLSS